MRSAIIDRDWQEVARIVGRAGESVAGPGGLILRSEPLWLALDTMVVPHLILAVAPAAASEEPGEAERPRVLLFVCRTAVHEEDLRATVAPMLGPDVAQAVVVRGDAGTFVPLDGSAPPRPLTALVPFLEEHGGTPGLSPDAFAWLGAAHAALAAFRAAEVEAAPLRLGEALLARGHAGRIELYNGEVPIVVALGSDRAAERSLSACVDDAVALVGAAPATEAGWTVVGPVRLRTRGDQLLLRVRLSAADRASVFGLPLPEGVPSLLGLLLAGAEDGRMERSGDQVLCRMRCPTRAVQAQLRTALAGALTALGAPLTVHDQNGLMDPEGWFLMEEGLVSWLFVPVHRDQDLPWRILSGGARADPTAPPRPALSADHASVFLSQALVPGLEVQSTPGGTSLRVRRESMPPGCDEPAAFGEPAAPRWALRQAIAALIERHAIAVSAAERQLVEVLDERGLTDLCRFLAAHGRWPSDGS